MEKLTLNKSIITIGESSISLFISDNKLHCKELLFSEEATGLFYI